MTGSNLKCCVLFMLGFQFSLSYCAPKNSIGDIKSTVSALFKIVEGAQVKEDVPYKPPTSWQKHKGMWESDVRFYFHGRPEFFIMREGFSIYDDNMFATAWITSCLLETYRYGNGPKPSDDSINNVVLSIREYHNKNVNYSNSLMTFWPQEYNSTTKTWVSYPLNLHHFFALAASTNFTEFEKILSDLGLKDVADIMARLLRSETGYLHAFMIPPDFDDTFVNLGLGSLLAEMKDDFPQSQAQWDSQNTNITSVFDALKKYAYRPMSDNKAVNTIDCRTYFYLRYFLERAVQNKEDIALVPTWVQDTEEVKVWGPKGVDMPFNINNIDVTVAANGVFGMTSAILNGLVEASVLDDPIIKQVYLNTSDLIAFMIETNFSSRHDLALLYYPSEIEFYWFVARTFGELERKSKHGPLPHPVLDTVKSRLDKVLHNEMTWAVINQTRKDSHGNLYIDDFVGDGDLDENNHTVVRGQDRLFTTGMAINALLSAWTTFDESSRQLIWNTETPQVVKDTVKGAANFVNENILGLKYQPWNAFFSGSVKGHTTHYGYPTNRHSFNQSFETAFSDDPSNINSGYYPFLRGMEGVVTEQMYQEMLKKYHVTDIDFHGYNSYPDYWPFWCSEPYTYVTTMLALAKYSNTVEANNNATFPVYPMNRERDNETLGETESLFMAGFQGVIPESEYKSLLQKKWFGSLSPLDFHGYNGSPDYWPFWCSQPYTYVTNMLALAKYSNTVEPNDAELQYKENNSA